MALILSNDKDKDTKREALEREYAATVVSIQQGLARQLKEIDQKDALDREKIYEKYYKQLDKMAADNARRREDLDRKTSAFEDKIAKQQERMQSTIASGVASAWTTAFSSMIDGSESCGKAMLKAIIGSVKSAVMAYAASAAAGAASSQASIPVIGPELAVAASALIFGLVEALVSSIPSAAGGFDVPANINPLTQLHGGEMVLPANIADPLRQQVGSEVGDIHVHIHAVDGESVRRLVQSHDFVQAIKEARRYRMGI
jgi:hypothetical protein